MEINTWHHHKNSDGRTLVSHSNKRRRGDADGYGLHANDFSNSKGDGAGKKFVGIRFRPMERNEVGVVESLFGVRREDWQKPILGSAYQRSGSFSETNEADMHIDSEGKGYIPNIARDSISRKKSRIYTTKHNSKTPSLELYESNLKYLKQDLPFNKHIASNAVNDSVFSTIAYTNHTYKLVNPLPVKHNMNESSVLFIVASFPFIVGNLSLKEQQIIPFNLITADAKLLKSKTSFDLSSKIHRKRNRRFISFNSYVNHLNCGESCGHYNKSLINKDNYLESKFYSELEKSTSVNSSNLEKSEKFHAFKTLNSGNVTVAQIFINQSDKRNQRFKNNKPFTYAADSSRNTRKSHPIDGSHQFREDPELRPISDNIETDVGDENSETYHGDKVPVTLFHRNESSVEEDDLVPRSTDELRKKFELQIYDEKSFDKDSGVLKTGTGAGDQLSGGIRKEEGANGKQYIYSRLNDLNAGSKDPEESFNHKGIRENGKSLKSSKQTFRVHSNLSPTGESSALPVRSELIRDGIYQEIKRIVSDNGHVYFTYLKPIHSNKTNPIGPNNAMSIESKEMGPLKKYKIERMKRNVSKFVALPPGIMYSEGKFHKPDMSISSLRETKAIDSRYSSTNLLHGSILSRQKRQFERIPQINSYNNNGDPESLIIVIDKSALPIAAFIKKNDHTRENRERYNIGWNSGSKVNPEIVTSHPLEYRDKPRLLNVLPISNLAGESKKTFSRHAFANTRQNLDNRWRILRPASLPVRNMEQSNMGQSKPIAPQQHNESHVTIERPRHKLKSWFETRVFRGIIKNSNGNPPQIWYIILPVENSKNHSSSTRKRETLQQNNDEVERSALPQRESEDDDSENTPGNVVRTPAYFFPKNRRVEFTPRGAKHNKPSLRQYERLVEGEQFDLNNDTDHWTFLKWFNNQWGLIQTTTPEGDEMTTNHPNDVISMKQPDNQLTTGYPDAKHSTESPNNQRTKKQPNNIPTAGYRDMQSITEQPNNQNTVQYPGQQFTTVKTNYMLGTTKKPDILLSTMLPANHREPKQLTMKDKRIKLTIKYITRLSSTTKSPKRPSTTSFPKQLVTTKPSKRLPSIVKSPQRPATTKSSRRPSSASKTKQLSTQTVSTTTPISINVTKKPENIINKPKTHDPWWDYHNPKVWKKPVPCSKGFVPNNPWKIWHKTTTTGVFGGD